MISRILTSAIFAGLAAGLLAAALQFWLVIPALQEGELYESGQRIHFGAGTPESERGAPGLGNDLGRHAMTVAFDLVTYTGYGLVLLGLMVAARARHAISARAGLIWGVCGFIAVQLAPAVGLPPELPGTPAAELGPRQAWWALAVLSTGVGLGLIAFGRGWLALAGAVPIALPHVIGAPHLDTYWGVAPPELAAHFVSLSLGTSAAGWAALGALAGWFWSRADG